MLESGLAEKKPIGPIVNFSVFAREKIGRVSEN